MRKFGAAEDLSEFVTPELDLDDELALRLTLAAKEATGKWAHYPAAAGAGTTVWSLVDVPELVLPEPTVKASVRALMQGLTQTTVNDHRAALAAYVAKRGIPTAPLAGGGLRLLFADGGRRHQLRRDATDLQLRGPRPPRGRSRDAVLGDHRNHGGDRGADPGRRLACGDADSRPRRGSGRADSSPEADEAARGGHHG